MPRAIWTGAISFGLVNVPVKLYSAISPKTVRFNQLHEKDGVRIQQKRICPADGEEVPFDQIVKGYEIAPDQYVVVTKEELEALEPPKTKTIDVEEFVDADAIDPIYYDRAYYVAPDRAAAKPYRLLASALEDAGKVAIGRVVIRSREQLVAMRASDGMLTMSTMNFADEVVSPGDLEERPEADAKAGKREVDMAHQLVESLTDEFDPERYRDTYRERVLELIEQKAEGKEIELKAPDEPREAPDLMAALEASVAAARDERGGGQRSGGGRRRGAKESAKPKQPSRRRAASKR